MSTPDVTRPFSGTHVFITGAARGQGRSHAVRFAELGADVLATDLCGPLETTLYDGSTVDDLAETARLVEQAGGRILTKVVDVRDAGGLAAAVADGVAEFGPVGVAIANAGISPAPASLLDTTPEQWREVLDINLTGVFHTIQVAGRSMVEGGRGGAMVLISSIMGLRSYGGIPGYVASKHGVVGLMRTSAVELAPHRIRVNSVHPGNVATPMVLNDSMYRLFRPDLEAPGPDDLAAGMTGMNLLPGPWAEASDITEAVVWLCSPAARYVTGVTLPVDLGATIK